MWAWGGGLASLDSGMQRPRSRLCQPLELWQDKSWCSGMGGVPRPREACDLAEIVLHSIKVCLPTHAKMVLHAHGCSLLTPATAPGAGCIDQACTGDFSRL